MRTNLIPIVRMNLGITPQWRDELNKIAEAYSKKLGKRIHIGDVIRASIKQTYNLKGNYSTIKAKYKSNSE